MRTRKEIEEQIKKQIKGDGLTISFNTKLNLELLLDIRDLLTPQVKTSGMLVGMTEFPDCERDGLEHKFERIGEHTEECSECGDIRKG